MDCINMGSLRPWGTPTQRQEQHTRGCNSGCPCAESTRYFILSHRGWRGEGREEPVHLPGWPGVGVELVPFDDGLDGGLLTPPTPPSSTKLATLALLLPVPGRLDLDSSEPRRSDWKLVFAPVATAGDACGAPWPDPSNVRFLFTLPEEARTRPAAPGPAPIDTSSSSRSCILRFKPPGVPGVVGGLRRGSDEDAVEPARPCPCPRPPPGPIPVVLSPLVRLG